MNSKRWTPSEIEKLLSLHEQGYSCRDVADMLSRGENSVRIKLLALGYSSSQATPTESRKIVGATEPPAEEDVIQSAYELRARRELEAAERRMEERDLLNEAKRDLLEQKIVEEFRKALCDLPQPIVVGEPPTLPRGTDALTAVLIVSDVHAGKVVDPEETEGFGNYNPAVTVARVRHLELEALRILGDRPVKKLLVLFGGDIVEGQLGHAIEDDLTVPVALQVDFSLNLFFLFLCGLSRAVPEMEIYGVPGNHGRWPTTRKMPSLRRWSNLDTVLYGALAALCSHAGLGNVTWDERISTRRTIDAGGVRLQLLHGDEVRGGLCAVNGMAREVGQSTMRHLQAGRLVPTYFIMGDKHTPASIPFGSGAFVINGNFVGTDSFGMGFAPAPPSQTLFFLKDGVGRTETHEIHLGHAQLPTPLPYALKPAHQRLIQRYL